MSIEDGIDVLQRPAAGSEIARLSRWDDLPLHNNAEIFAAIEPPTEHWAERYYFNMLAPSGEIAGILGAGIFSRRGIAECYFCRLEGGVQHNVRACQPLPTDKITAGRPPFSLRCIAPMHTWDAVVDVAGNNFAGRYRAVTEPYHYSPVVIPASEPGGTFDDWQHVVAAGIWGIETFAGYDTVDEFLCIRDRTWGVRTRRMRLHNWLVFEMDGVCINILHQERADGSILYSEAGVARPGGINERLTVKAYDFNFDPSTREARSGYFDLSGDTGDLRLEYETVGMGIRLNGAGYDNTQGERSAGVQTDTYDLNNPDEACRSGRGTIDIGAHAQVTGAWCGEGAGVIESAVARDHVRFGERVS